MLVLNRRVGQSVFIYDENTKKNVCVVKVLAPDEFHPGSFRFGFEAPKNISIIRDDVINKESS